MRPVRLIAVALLGGLCLLGALETVRGASTLLQRVAGQSADGATVGVPLAGARGVRAVRVLLPPASSPQPAPWLVLLHRGAESIPRLYMQYQLAHLEYPRRVDVISIGEAPPLREYAGVIAAPGITLSAPWRAVAERAGFRRYVRPAP